MTNKPQPTGIEEMEKQLRELLNDFFLDVDTEARINTEIANAIVDVHLKKLTAFISTTRREAVEEEKQYRKAYLQGAKDMWEAVGLSGDRYVYEVTRKKAQQFINSLEKEDGVK